MDEQIKSQVLIRIVDDDAGSREALSFMLACKGWEVCAYESATQFLKLDIPAKPGCLLLDIRMPEMSGVQLQSRMKALQMTLPIIFITGHGDIQTAVATVKAGALDFLQKPVNAAELLAAIEPAVEISLSRAQGRLAPEAARSVLAEMSPREKEITKLLLHGISNQEIADRLQLSRRTVQGHRYNIYRKLLVHNEQEFRQCVERLDGMEGLGGSAESAFAHVPGIGTRST